MTDAMVKLIEQVEALAIPVLGIDTGRAARSEIRRHLLGVFTNMQKAARLDVLYNRADMADNKE